MAYLPAVEIKSAATPQASIIWLHGMGADGSDFVSIVRELRINLSGALGIRFYPSPRAHAACHHERRRCAPGYDIAGPDLARGQDEAGVRRSQREIEKLIARERDHGIDLSRIVLAGFSQGGAIALQTGLRYPKPLAGIVALSSYVPIAETLKRIRRTAASRSLWLTAFRTSSFHLFWREPPRDFLERLGYRVLCHDYFMPYLACMEEIAHMGDFLRRVLS